MRAMGRQREEIASPAACPARSGDSRDSSSARRFPDVITRRLVYTHPLKRLFLQPQRPSSVAAVTLTGGGKEDVGTRPIEARNLMPAAPTGATYVRQRLRPVQ